MPDWDLEKLLGGYATGTLTEAERKTLLEASLHDQALFNALADEQALKELLHDPAARRRLLEALDRVPAQQKAGLLESVLAWFRRPANLALAGSLATALLAVLVFTNLPDEKSLQTEADFLTADEKNQALTEAESSDDALDEDATPTDQPARDRVGKTEPEQTQPSLGRKRERADRPVAQRPLTPQRSAGVAKSRTAKHEKKEDDELVKEKLEAEEAPQALLQKKSQPAPAAPPVPPASLEHAEAPTASAPEAGRVSAPLERRQVPQGAFSEVKSARDLYYRQPGRVAPPEGFGRREQAGEGLGLEPEPVQEQARVRSFADEAAGLSGVVQHSPVAVPQETTLGLRYSILKRQPDGHYAETNAEGPFSANDQLRLTVEVNESGHLYVVQQLGPDRWTFLYPPSAQVGGLMRTESAVVSRTRYVIPSIGTLSVPTSPRETNIRIVFSRGPLTDLRSLSGQAEAEERSLAPMVSSPKKTPRSAPKRKAAERRILIEKITPEKPNAPREHAVYVAGAGPSPESPITVDFALSTR